MRRFLKVIHKSNTTKKPPRRRRDAAKPPGPKGPAAKRQRAEGAYGAPAPYLALTRTPSEEGGTRPQPGPPRTTGTPLGDTTTRFPFREDRAAQARAPGVGPTHSRSRAP